MNQAASIPPLESFGRYHEEPKSSGSKRPRPRPPTLLEKIFIRWSCTKGDLIDSDGEPMTDSVYRKAYAYATEDHISVTIPAHYASPEYVWSEYNVTPLPGLKQEHRIRMAEYKNGHMIVSCDCQRCRRHGLMCSQILGLMFLLDKFPLQGRLSVVEDIREMEL